LSRNDDVLTAVRDTDPLPSEYGNIVNDNPARAGRKLGATDPPRHEQLLKLVDAVFARRAVDQYEPSIRMLGVDIARYRELAAASSVMLVPVPPNRQARIVSTTQMWVAVGPTRVFCGEPGRGSSRVTADTKGNHAQP
jgi:hypothetical protein